MKLGLGLYRHMLNPEGLRFARQAGATHIVAHLVDYFRGLKPSDDNQPVGDNGGWGRSDPDNDSWNPDKLLALRKLVESEGLKLEAIENFEPAQWCDVLLDGPRKTQQLAHIQSIIENMGQAGIPIMGYNFSLAGVCGRVTGPYARGAAHSVGMDGPFDLPVPSGMVWNMTVDSGTAQGHQPPVTHDMLWSRLHSFLEAILPTAEKAGVRLAAHPDDPPTPTMRGTPRLVYQPHLYQRLLDLKPSSSNTLEFCLGTLSEMTEGDIYDTVDHYSKQNKIAYIHLRNVRGKAPHYHETFLDDGQMDVRKVLQILRKNRFEGVMIPDHAPHMACSAPWHAGMAHAMGYMKALME